MEKLTAEGIYVGRWQPGMGENYDGMCDRVGSEYWRNVLRQEMLAWAHGASQCGPRVLAGWRAARWAPPAASGHEG